MSDASSLPVPSAAARKAAPSSWMGAVGLRVLGRRGAQLGMAWVGVLALCAVFAPFFASSFPYVWHERGQTTYPLFSSLTPVDVVLLLAALFAAVLAVMRRVPGRIGAWVWLVVAAVPAVEWRVWMDGVRQMPLEAAGRSVGFLPPGFWCGCIIGAAVLAAVAVARLAGWVGSSFVGWAARLGAMLAAAWLVYGANGLFSGGSRSDRMALLFWAGSAAVVLLILGFLVAWAMLSRAPRWLKAGALGMALVLGGFFAVRPVHPPENYDHSHYRMAQKEGVGHGVFAPIPYSPSDLRSDIPERLSYNAPSAKAWFGTDRDGCDLASRMIHACRVALTIGLLSTAIALAIGIVVGGLMGYFAGWVDMIGMRLVEIFSAIPVLPILIMICAFYERNIYLMMVILGLFGWVGYAIFIRAEFLRLRTSDFVQAARAVGASTPRILIRHMLPSGVTPVLTLASFGVAGAIMIETTLSFLGLGLKPEDPSWGQPIEQLPDAGAEKWWLVVFPSAAIFLTVFSYNLIGESLRDALDPKQNK